MRYIFVLILALCCHLSDIKAGVVDHDRMFESYLAGDMAVWAEEIERCTKVDTLTVDDKLDLCNYLYGYIAVILKNEEKSRVEEWLSLWEGYLDAVERDGRALSVTQVYRSSVAAYRAMLYPIKALGYASQSIKTLDKALETDAENPLAIGLKGNMKFYMPAIAGGSKREALKLFIKALAIFDADCPVVYRWNYCSMQLCLAQAYEKTGDIDQAISIAQSVLAREPGYAYVRDVYLPSLLEK